MSFNRWTYYGTYIQCNTIQGQKETNYVSVQLGDTSQGHYAEWKTKKGNLQRLQSVGLKFHVILKMKKKNVIEMENKPLVAKG